MKWLEASRPKDNQTNPANMSINNSEKNAKYFTQQTLDMYVDSYDRNCQIIPCWVCSDIKANVVRQNANLGVFIGFSK